MSKKLRNFTILVAIIGGVSAAAYFLSKYVKKNLLKVKRLISKNTEILNIYTYDYVATVAPFLEAKDSNEGTFASVYTDRAKRESKGCTGERLDKKDIQNEYEQVLRFGKEMLSVSPGAKIVIHTNGEVSNMRFGKIKNDLELETGLEVEVSINNENLSEMFEEE